MIGIVDYGAGNLRNVQAAVRRSGAPHRLVSRPDDLAGIERLILPGVGRFGAAARRLEEAGLVGPLRDHLRARRPFLGICVGMQLLFEGSDEDPAAEGLGALPGVVRRLESERLPHIGWALVEQGDDPAAGDAASIFRGLPRDFFAYFAHSYAAAAETAAAVARTSCPPVFTAAVRRGPIWGVQFHPEKSGADGQRVIANFATNLSAGGAADAAAGGAADRAGSEA